MSGYKSMFSNYVEYGKYNCWCIIVPMSDPRTGSDKPTETVPPVPQDILFGTASLRDLLDGVVLDVVQLEGLEGIIPDIPYI